MRALVLSRMSARATAGRRVNSASTRDDVSPAAGRCEVMSTCMLLISGTLMLGLFLCSERKASPITMIGLIIGSLSCLEMALARMRKSRERELLADRTLLDGEGDPAAWRLALLEGVSLREPQEDRNRMLPTTSSLIEALPTHRLSADHVSSASGEHRSCSICIQDFEAGEEQKTLPCFHRFHKGCIDGWLHRKGICPLCKHRVDGDMHPDQQESYHHLV